MEYTTHGIEFNKPFITITDGDSKGRTWEGIFEQNAKSPNIDLVFNCLAPNTAAVVKSVRFKNFDESLLKLWKKYENDPLDCVKRFGVIHMNFPMHSLHLHTGLPKSSIVDLSKTEVGLYIENAVASADVAFISDADELCYFDVHVADSLKTAFKNVSSYDQIHMKSMTQSLINISEDMDKKLLFIDSFGQGALSYDPQKSKITLFNATTKKFFKYDVYKPTTENENRSWIYRRMDRAHIFGTITKKQNSYTLNVINTSSFQIAAQVDYRTLDDLEHAIAQSPHPFFVHRNKKDLKPKLSEMSCLYIGESRGLKKYQIVNTSNGHAAHPPSFGQPNGVEFSIPEGSSIGYIAKMSELIETDKETREKLKDILVVGHCQGEKHGLVTNDGILSVPLKWKALGRHPIASAAKRAKTYIEKHLDEYLLAKTALEHRDTQNESFKEAEENEVLDNMFPGM